MKFSITIDQKRSVEWGLSFTEAAVFSVIFDAAAWAVRDGDYWFLSREHIMRELPMVTEKADTVYRYCKALHDKGVVEYRRIGKRDFFRLTRKGLLWNRVGDTPPSSWDNGRKKSDSHPSCQSYPQGEQNFLPETRMAVRENSDEHPEKLGQPSDRSVNNINHKQYYPSAEAQMRVEPVDNSAVENFGEQNSQTGLPVGDRNYPNDVDLFALENSVVTHSPEFSRVVMPKAPHKITAEWRPEPWVYELLERNHGISRAEADWELMDFVIYWSGRGFVGLGWNRKFHDRVVAQKRAGRIPELPGAGSRQPFVDSSNANTDWADLPLKKINNVGGV